MVNFINNKKVNKKMNLKKIAIQLKILNFQWKKANVYQKLKMYTKPLIKDLCEVWREPFPLPTFFKILHSSYILFLIFFPFIFLMSVNLSYFAIVQYMIEK